MGSLSSSEDDSSEAGDASAACGIAEGDAVDNPNYPTVPHQNLPIGYPTGGIPAEPATCNWAVAADAVVLATVEGVALYRDEVARELSGGEWTYVDDCPDIDLVPAIVVDLKIQRVLQRRAASASLQSGADIALHVGSDHARRWREAQYSVEYNTPELLLFGLPGQTPLQCGLQVIAPLYEFATERWSLSYDSLLGVRADGTIEVPNLGEYALVPEDLHGTEASSAAAMIEACTPDVPEAQGAEQTRSYHAAELISGGNPVHYHAARCLR